MEHDTIDRQYYIASARCYEMKYFDGKIAMPHDAVAWLGWTTEGGGWPECTLNQCSAKHFASLDAIRQEAFRWDGMPWYFRLQPGTLEIFLVREVRPVLTRTVTAIADGDN